MGECNCGNVESAPSHRLPVVCRCTVAAVFLVSLQLTNLMTAVTCATGLTTPESVVDLTELRRNIVRGLKLEKLPDMAVVDIGNDEFHCKYLEYFRRLYASDESEYYPVGDDDVEDGGDDRDDVTAAADDGIDDDDGDRVSATQVRGQVKYGHDVIVGDDRRSLRLPTTDDKAEVHATVTFPINQTLLRKGASDGHRVTVIKSVARIYGGSGVKSSAGTSSDLRVLVYGRLCSNNSGGSRQTTSLVANVTWPSSGGRWKDLDVTRLLRSRKRYGDVSATLELYLRYSVAAAETMRFDHDGRLPTLHAFLDGALDGGTAAAADQCAGGQTKRTKRDGGSHGRKGHRRPSVSGRVRRTDCKTEAAQSPPSSTNANGTEHGGGNKCCREEMRVVFADIPGFDFIVEPKWFDAGLCRGRCPAKYNPATRHAFIQSLLWKQHYSHRDGGAEVTGKRVRRRLRHHGGVGTPGIPLPPPKPCCAPSKLEQLEIIHVDETDPNALKVTTWKEMTVVECACS